MSPHSLLSGLSGLFPRGADRNYAGADFRSFRSSAPGEVLILTAAHPIHLSRNMPVPSLENAIGSGHRLSLCYFSFAIAMAFSNSTVR